MHLSFSAVNENADENETPFMAEDEMKTKTDIHFPPKNENESHLIILVFLFFFIYSVTKSVPQRAANASSSFAFLQVVFVDGIPLPHVHCISLWHFSRWHFNFQPVNSLLSWFIATKWKQFSTIYALYFTGICFGFIKIVPLYNLKRKIIWKWTFIFGRKRKRPKNDQIAHFGRRKRISVGL